MQNLSEEDKKKKRNSIQMQMVILDSDGRKLINEKNLLDAELRNLRMDQDRLRIAMEEKQKKYNEMDFKISQNEDELRRLKKKLNLL